MKQELYFGDNPYVNMSNYDTRSCQKQLENYCNNNLQNYVRLWNEQFNVIWNYLKSGKCWEANGKHRIILAQLNTDETF